LGIPKESWHGERRVAITPQVAATLVKKGFNVNVESGAGIEANFKDAGVKKDKSFYQSTPIWWFQRG